MDILSIQAVAVSPEKDATTGDSIQRAEDTHIDTLRIKVAAAHAVQGLESENFVPLF